jgi:hypothetical protein
LYNCILIFFYTCTDERASSLDEGEEEGRRIVLLLQVTIEHDQFLISGNYFFYFPFTLFSLLFTIFYSYVLFAGHFIEGAPKRGANGGFDSSRAAPLLTTDEAMNHAFGTSSEEEEDEVEEVGEEEADGGQQHNHMFLSLVNFYSQLD